jgi:outer membrane protein assembly factor BamE (lipoprotein component of BamABCDE complex)
MIRRRSALAYALLVVSLAGCRATHYVVVESDAPLYRDPTSDDVVARMPRYHHEPLEALDDEPRDRIPLAFEGRRGWAERGSVRVFEYLDPSLDEGADQARTIRNEVRELQLADLGRGWSEGQLEAIRGERVLEGMTRTQVELAWGWPVTVEPTALAGGERWVYKEAQLTPVRRWADTPWTDTWGSCPAFGAHRDDWRTGPTWVTVRLPVTVERIVEFDAEGKVTTVRVRRYLGEAGPS